MTSRNTLEEYLDRIRRLEADIEHLTNHDALTGLLTRAAFLAILDKHAANKANHGQGALITLAIRNMPRISGTLGRHVGDYVITAIASRLNIMDMATAIKCRLGYDQFGIFLPNLSEPLSAMTTTKDVVHDLGRPVDWLDRTLSIDVIAGVALASDNNGDSANLVINAELALRNVTQRGGAHYAFFNPALAQIAKRRSDIQAALIDAIEHNGLYLHYQPIFDAKTSTLQGFEALLRLENRDLGQVSPTDFVPVAEEAGLISRMGAWALAEACRAAAKWPGHLGLSVNISPEQFYTGSVATDVHNALELSSLPSHRLELEVTESTVLKDAEHVQVQLNALQEMGCPIALDDFGTGYSSLSYLWKFPFSKIKIDRAFIAALDATPMARGILQSIFGLASHLGLKVTAEGIETEAHHKILVDLGADYLQGYLMGQPIPEREIPALLDRLNRQSNTSAVRLVTSR